ncbi:hypothetical protein [Desulfobacula phenolica]|uniref:Uncharacterized protein n=1 Tax=Desulfobacula phenolica TaxID=90732 RepID=A0A1H2K2H0_9BACT|nr:hypothetical protein [Desulfobacula phenolica]SDU62618.1 hypothetical protein SAMN04487931_1194 [Desulfobacula phenolica]
MIDIWIEFIKWGDSIDVKQIICFAAIMSVVVGLLHCLFSRNHFEATINNPESADQTITYRNRSNPIYQIIESASVAVTVFAGILALYTTICPTKVFGAFSDLLRPPTITQSEPVREFNEHYFTPQIYHGRLEKWECFDLKITRNFYDRYSNEDPVKVIQRRLRYKDYQALKEKLQSAENKRNPVITICVDDIELSSGFQNKLLSISRYVGVSGTSSTVGQLYGVPSENVFIAENGSGTLRFPYYKKKENRNDWYEKIIPTEKIYIMLNLGNFIHSNHPLETPPGADVYSIILEAREK